MQAVFPSWVTTLIINYPDRFTSMATCWTAINAEAMRQAAGRKSVLQLSDPMLAGEMEAYPEDFSTTKIFRAQALPCMLWSV